MLTRFLFLLAVAALVFAVTLFLFLRAPRGRTRTFLGIAWISAIAFPVCAILHNATEALLHVEEPVFFLLAVIAAPVGIVVGLAGAAIAALSGGNGPRSA